MRIALGVPTLRRYDLLAKLLTSAAQGTRRPDAIIVVDNGGSLAPLAYEALVVQEGNLGVAASWNRMSRIAFGPQVKADALLIVADDVELHAGCIEAMAHTMTNEDRDFVHPNLERCTRPEMFTCFMVRPKLFERVGYFDENFWPAYFEDNDFHRRMRLAGVKEGVALEASYDHFGSATLATYLPPERALHNRQFEANRDRYVAKWGGLPGHERFTVPFGGVEL